jgi:hypothetical protein
MVEQVVTLISFARDRIVFSLVQTNFVRYAHKVDNPTDADVGLNDGRPADPFGARPDFPRPRLPKASAAKSRGRQNERRERPERGNDRKAGTAGGVDCAGELLALAVATGARGVRAALRLHRGSLRRPARRRGWCDPPPVVVLARSHGDGRNRGRDDHGCGDAGHGCGVLGLSRGFRPGKARRTGVHHQSRSSPPSHSCRRPSSSRLSPESGGLFIGARFSAASRWR